MGILRLDAAIAQEHQPAKIAQARSPGHTSSVANALYACLAFTACHDRRAAGGLPAKPLVYGTLRLLSAHSRPSKV